MKKHSIVPLVIMSMCLSTGCNKEQETKETQKTSQEAPMTKTTLPSGLIYEIITAGTSEKTAEKGHMVKVHYTGWLEENGKPGKKFDSSVDRGTPFEFPLGKGYVIKGWDEGVAGMKVGEKRRLIIPEKLGYGARGAGRDIPPFATLIFDVELIDAK